MNKDNETQNLPTIEELANHFKTLMFQLLQERVLRFDILRSLKINTFFLNYFLLQNYFIPFELQDKRYGRDQITEDQLADCSLFREHVETLHGIFIMVPMHYQRENIYTKAQTDKIINQIDVYGKISNTFFSSYENLIAMDMNDIEPFLKDFEISDNFLPSLDYDPEYEKILDSKAINQLFLMTSKKEYIEQMGLVRYNFPIEKKQLAQFQDAMTRWDEHLFSFNPSLKIYDSFLRYPVNCIAVKDFGSKPLIEDFIALFKNYYSLRVPSRKKEVMSYLDFYKCLFFLSKGRLYIKFSWNTLKDTLSYMGNQDYIGNFLDQVCMFKSFSEFPETIEEFDPHKFISDYHSFLRYGCYCYSGFVYTGAPLIWRSMIKYFEELQRTDEFQESKGALLENWCLELIETYGFQVEKVILKNKNLPSNENYISMKEQIKTFRKEPLEFEVDFIDHQKKYSFHEFDLIFRVDQLLFIVECKGTAVRLSQQPRYISWTRNFKEILDVHNKKIENLVYNIEKSSIEHTLFEDIVKYIPIIIQTEGIFHEIYGYTTNKFRILLTNLRKHYKEGDLMKTFRES